MKKHNNPTLHHLPGFSLMEMAIVLIIVGILAGALFKGLDVLESAKIRSALNDIHRIRMAVLMYQEQFHYMPGKDPTAQVHFGPDVQNGQGKGSFTDPEMSQFWIHLTKGGFLTDDQARTSKLGGLFLVKSEQGRHYLILSGENGEGILTPKQAAALKSAAQDGAASHGEIHVQQGTGSSEDECVKNGAFNLAVTKRVCILKVELN